MKKLGFGLMRLPLIDEADPASVDLAKTCELVDTFIEHGYTYFDTAYLYHGAQSEIIAKEALVKRHPREKFTLASKLPGWLIKKPEDLERIFEEQLEKCGVSYFDFYLVHGIDDAGWPSVKKREVFPFVRRMKDEGKIRKIGFSFHGSPDTLRQVLDANPDVDIVQLQLNYLDWNNDAIQSKVCYDICTERKKPVVVMEPVKGGALASLPEEAEKVFRALRPDDSMASWGVRFAASLPNVAVVLSGMSDLSQVLDNAAQLAETPVLSEDELAAVAKVREIILSMPTIPCTGCNYCLDGCPEGIPIPTFFALYNTLKRDGWQAYPDVEYKKLIASGPRTDACIECGACEGICPQHLPIIEHLKEIDPAFKKS